MADATDGEWSLYWTSRGRPVSARPAPVLAGWADLDQREEAAGIGPGQPILIDPQYQLDPGAGAVPKPVAVRVAGGGDQAGVREGLPAVFRVPWQRGRYWHEADPDDLLDWEAWRRRDQQSGREIGGSKWRRELAALRLVYERAEKERHIARSPVLVHQVRLRGGGTATVADQAPRDVRSADVKWVTPRTYRLWRDIGLLGYDADGQPDSSWRGRNDGRNAAYTDLLFSGGLRLREGGCLLTLEVPDAAAGHGYREGTVAGAVAKRRQRMFYASAAAPRSDCNCASPRCAIETVCSRGHAVAPIPCCLDCRHSFGGWSVNLYRPLPPAIYRSLPSADHTRSEIVPRIRIIAAGASAFLVRAVPSPTEVASHVPSRRSPPRAPRRRGR